MNWNFFSFFLNNEEPFLQLNTNILDTNVINIAILVGLLVYGYKSSVGPSLEARQKEIAQTIENAQNDVLKARATYISAEKSYTQSQLWLESWKESYQLEKIEIVTNRYKQIKNALLETFLTTETLVTNYENRSYLSLQKYIVYLTASRILRKFLLLSDLEQSKVIESTITKLGGSKK
jgi:F-type H+-transporting ATPase subunit b